MKKHSLFFGLFFIALSVCGQNEITSLSDLVIKNQKIEVYATRNDEPVHKSTREAHITINFETGEFYCGVQLKDLQLLNEDELPEGIERRDGPYFQIKGVMPCREMIYNDASDQQYKVEMELINNDQILPVVFEVYVKNYQQTYGGFRQFIGAADIDLRDLGNDELQGYKPEIKLVFSFQAFKQGN